MVREAARAQRFSPDVVDGPAGSVALRGFGLLSIGTGWGNGTFRSGRGRGGAHDRTVMATGMAGEA
jgi:hypothetical protein